MLRVSAAAAAAPALVKALLAAPGVHALASANAAGGDGVVLTAEVDAAFADAIIDRLIDLGVSSHDYTLARLDVVAPSGARTEADEATSWYEILGEARRNSRPFARYLVLMAVAGALAGAGVLDQNQILIIGAMAVSPDLLPVCALCVGLVGRRRHLVGRAAGTLIVGLVLSAMTAGLLTSLLDAAGLLADEFTSGTFLSGLTTVDEFTVVVALLAGVAAILSFQTRASAAVGVAISVTTIPASADMGVASVLGEGTRALESLGVLGVNVSLLIASGTITLLLQTRGRVGRRSESV